MKKSPFMLLKEAIENELFNHSLELQSHMLSGLETNSSFALGYSYALKYMLTVAECIYRNGRPPR